MTTYKLTGRKDEEVPEQVTIGRDNTVTTVNFELRYLNLLAKDILGNHYLIGIDRSSPFLSAEKSIWVGEKELNKATVVQDIPIMNTTSINLQYEIEGKKATIMYDNKNNNAKLVTAKGESHLEVLLGPQFP